MDMKIERWPKRGIITLLSTASILLIFAIYHILSTDWSYVNVKLHMNQEWAIKIPKPGVILYEYDSRAGFHNDGITYRVIKYDMPNNKADFTYDWYEIADVKIHNMNCISYYMDFEKSRNFSPEWRPNFKSCSVMTKNKDDDCILIFGDDDLKTLYVLEVYL